jgi:hypothetical protein
VSTFVLLLCGSAEGANCDFYNRLNRYCGCKETDYFLGYGRRYCDRFQNATGWTPAGAKWRDRTLVCLQESLTQQIKRDLNGVCNCEKAKAIAWQTHVRCYTQSSASVCQLPIADVAKIYSIIDVADLLNPSGVAQFFAITGTCIRERIDRRSVSEGTR